MRVSLIELTDTHASFAPHVRDASQERFQWLRLPLETSLETSVLEAGQVGDFEGDEMAWLFEVDPSQRVERVRLKPCGHSQEMDFELVPGREKVSLAGHGIDARLKHNATRLVFWRLVPKLSGGPEGHFGHQDLKDWAEEIDREKAERAAEAARKTAIRRDLEQRRDAAGHFVNPYTFIPFPAIPSARTAPAGHHRLDHDRYSGRVTARLVTRSPLLVRNIGTEAGRDGDGDDAVYRAPRRNGTLFIPGSSLHGAIRSLHETLTGSCMRVFDADFVPVYRDVASLGLRNEWRLGVVTEVDDGANFGHPTAIRECRETGWIPAHLLAGALPRGRPLTTGQRFDLPGAFTKKRGRLTYDGAGPIVHNGTSGDWIVLVTNPSTRGKRIYCAVGKLPSTPTTVRLTDGAWKTFRRAAKGAKGTYFREPKHAFAEECRQVALRGLAAVIGDQEHRVVETGEDSPDATIILRWLRPRAWLHEGQVVWISNPRGGLTDGIALSYLWRTPGQYSAGRRLPNPAFAACHEPEHLCPSCRVFGSADLAEDASVDRRRATQRSYRGHIRVLDAVSEDADVLADPVRLPAAGSPRPGSGQFYLDDSPSEATDPPRNRWGSPVDNANLRRLRGRKFYWHTDPEADERRERWRRHEHASAEGGHQGELVELVQRGSTYRIELCFDGLSKAELGGLLATLRPQLLFGLLDKPLPYPYEGKPEFAIHVGGGKPSGLGSCQVEDLRVEADTPASRYLGEERPTVDPADAVAAFAADLNPLREHWKQVAAALHIDHVDSRMISYPTAKPWADDSGRCSGPAQHESFNWFRLTTGELLKQGERAFVTLPPVGELAQGLPVDVEARK